MDVATLCLALGLVSASPSLSPLPEERVDFACEHLGTLVEAAEENGFDPMIIAGLIYVESRWVPTAVSRSNACGLTQVLPRYVDQTCDELKDPTTSIRVGVDALKRWSTIRVRRNGRLVRVPRRGGIREALACYNAGNACLDSSNGRSYARAVMRHATRLRGAYTQLIERQEEESRRRENQNLGYSPYINDKPQTLPFNADMPASLYMPVLTRNIPL